jgi:hypothetical protein
MPQIDLCALATKRFQFSDFSSRACNRNANQMEKRDTFDDGLQKIHPSRCHTSETSLAHSSSTRSANDNIHLALTVR